MAKSRYFTHRRDGDALYGHFIYVHSYVHNITHNIKKKQPSDVACGAARMQSTVMAHTTPPPVTMGRTPHNNSVKCLKICARCAKKSNVKIVKLQLEPNEIVHV